MHSSPYTNRVNIVKSPGLELHQPAGRKGLKTNHVSEHGIKKSRRDGE